MVIAADLASPYYGSFVIMVGECFGRSTYCKNVPAQSLNILSLKLTKEYILSTIGYLSSNCQCSTT